MDLIMMSSVFCGILILFCTALLIALLKSSNRIIEINKQLLITVVGQNGKVETLRALVASSKPPKKNLPGITDDKKKKDDKTKNTNYTMAIGVTNGV